MFAILGEIIFEVVSSPETMERFRSWEYAEHRVIEDRPRLQWVSDPLERITLDLMFHVSFTDPAREFNALLAAAQDHNARPLIFGNGEYQGYFIITSLRTLSKQMSATGDPIAIMVQAGLKEWALGRELDPNAPPRPIAAPIAVVPGPAGSATGPVGYFAPTGAGGTIARLAAVYIPPTISAPGVSPILNNPSDTGPAGPQMLPDDVPPGQIVRSAA
ncbi:MAG: phage tail protein [Candidatus Binataceae bacterium]